MSDIDECCSVCFRRVGINTGDDGTPPHAYELGREAGKAEFLDLANSLVEKQSA